MALFLIYTDLYHSVNLLSPSPRWGYLAENRSTAGRAERHQRLSMAEPSSIPHHHILKSDTKWLSQIIQYLNPSSSLSMESSSATTCLFFSVGFII